MLAVTTTGMTLSIRYSAYALAAIALLGGFLTPLMLSTGQNQVLTLFSYILLLDIAAVVVAGVRRWPSLVLASLGGTIMLYIGWYNEFYTDPQRWIAFGVITVFFAFFNVYLFLVRLYSEEDESTIDQAIVFGSAAFFFLGFFSSYHWATVWPVKSFVLLLALFEIFGAEIIRRQAIAARVTIIPYAAVSVILTVVATFLILEQRWIMPALAAEMAVLGWMGLRLNLPLMSGGAYLLGLVVLFRFGDDLTFRLEPFESFIPLFNSRFLICGVAIAGFYVLLKFLWQYKDKFDLNEHHAPEITFVVTQILSLILLSVEVHDYFRFRSPGYLLGWGDFHYAYQMSLSVLWALYASLLIGVGIVTCLRGARVLGILLLGVTVLKVFLLDLSELQTFYRIISFIVLGLLLLAVSYGYNRFKNLIFGEDQP